MTDYDIPDANLHGLRTRVEKINRRAAKLGVPPVTYSEGEQWLSDNHIPHTRVTVGAEVVKLDGWRFAAAIEHDPEGNIVRAVPGSTVELSEYRTVAPWCEHCSLLRRRNDTFIVLHDDGRTAQIGRNCLVDFLGSDATAAAQQAEWLADLDAAFEDGSRDYSSAAPIDGAPILEYLEHVAAAIHEFGWLSRSKARETGDPATADMAVENMRRYRRGLEAIAPSDADHKAAKAALLWGRENYSREDADDFSFNMHVALAHDFMPMRRSGLAAYVIQAHRKALEKLATNSQWLGEVGNKITADVEVTRIVELSDYYNGGTKPLYLMLSAKGNSIKWFASSWGPGLEVGQAYRITGTVKKHDDDMSTILTRCKYVTV